MGNIAKILLVFLLMAGLDGYSRSTVRPTGSKPAGMGNAFVSQFDEFSVFHNQAGLAKLENTAISFFYENKFLVRQMSTRSGMISFPTDAGNFAIQYNSFGPPMWSESNAGIAYSRFLTEKLAAGIQLNYFGTRMPEDNTSARTASFETGFIYQITEKTALGLHLANPYAPSINTTVYEDDIPWRISIGGHTDYTDVFTFSYEVELIENYVPIAKAGAQWEAAENLFVRGGVNTSPSRVFLGFGYQSDFFSLDTAFSYHQYLGYVPSVSIIFSFF